MALFYCSPMMCDAVRLVIM